MDFLTQPMASLMDKPHLLDDIYKAVGAMDLSAAVLAALKAMRLTETVPTAKKTKVNPEQSRIYRTEGDGHFSDQRYLQAIECYNKAILFAPAGSTELLLAHSCRSALYFELKAHDASFNDIETCFVVGCPPELALRLIKRRQECISGTWFKSVENKHLEKGFPEDFFKFNVQKHSEIPCLSADVNVVSVAGERQVVAAKDIEIGSVIALEEAFTTYSGNNKSKVACYYCQKMTLTLMSCDTCCYALFCSVKCKKLCLSEYHDVECQIVDILEAINGGARFRLAIKTVLKLKSKYKGWRNLIEESKNIGARRLKASSVRKAYDVNECSSVLCFKEERHFVHGPLYNSCFMYATILYYLENVAGFFPESSVGRLKAMECFAKLCMSLGTMNTFVTEIDNAAEIKPEGQVRADLPCHYGLFAFTGKLKHSCDPNVMILGLDNRVALVAIKPIERMSEITVSYVGCYYDHLYGKNRALQIYNKTFNVCNCLVCKDAWGFNLYKKDLNAKQKKILHSWDKLREIEDRHRDPLFFKETCKALIAFKDLENTAKHRSFFLELRSQLSYCQYQETSNATV